MDIKEAIAKTADRIDLSEAEAKSVMEIMLSGEATQAQIAAFLTALRMKGETLDELVGLASVLRDKAETIAPEALGVNIMAEPELVKKCVDELGIGFMFAQLFNKSMKYVGQARKEMGIRTVFNILGPLANPSRAKNMVVGVYSPKLTEQVAKAMARLGVERAFVVSGADHMDEITLTGATTVSEIKDGEVTTFEITPEQFGLKSCSLSELQGGDGMENAKITKAILTGEEKGAKRDIVLLNAGATLYVGGVAESIAEGVKLAAETIDTGAAYKKLEELVTVSNR